MEADEVHPHFRQLGNVQLVVILIPPVGPNGKVMKGLDTPDLEEGPTHEIEATQLEIHAAIRDGIPVQVEAYSQALQELIRPVKTGHGGTAGDDQQVRLRRSKRF